MSTPVAELTPRPFQGYIERMMRADRTEPLPLVPTLLLAILAELVVHRIGLQLLKPEVLQPETEVFRLFNEGIGPVVFFFASFIALACCAWLLVNVILDDRFFLVSWRIMLGLASCVFLPVATVGVLVSTAGLKAPSRSLLELHPYLNVTFVVLALVVASGILLRRGPMLPKLGLLLLLVPLFLFAFFSDRTARIIGDLAATRSFYQQLRDVALLPRYGLLFLSAVGFWSFVFFHPLITLVERQGPAPPRLPDRLDGALRSYGRAFFELGPLLTALTTGLVFGIFVKLNYQTAVKVVEAAFAYNLPAPSTGGLLVVASVFLFTLTLAGLAWRPGPTRLAAVGLLAVVVAGFRLAQPLHDLRLTAPLYYLLGAVGLMTLGRAIAGAWDLAEESALAWATPAVEDSRWRRFLESLAASLAPTPEERPRIAVRARQATEISLVEGLWRGAQLSIRFGRRNRRLLSLTIVLGQELDERADWTATLAERGSRTRGSEGPERRLEVHDRARLSDRLLQESVVERLHQNLRGRVDIWHGLGLRYRAVGHWSVDLAEVIPLAQLASAEAEDGDVPLGRLLALCDLLYDLAHLAGVQGAGHDAEG
jgi:hypothetical protein